MTLDYNHWLLLCQNHRMVFYFTIIESKRCTFIVYHRNTFSVTIILRLFYLITFTSQNICIWIQQLPWKLVRVIISSKIWLKRVYFCAHDVILQSSIVTFSKTPNSRAILCHITRNAHQNESHLSKISTYVDIFLFVCAYPGRTPTTCRIVRILVQHHIMVSAFIVGNERESREYVRIMTLSPKPNWWKRDLSLSERSLVLKPNWWKYFIQISTHVHRNHCTQ